MNYEGSDVLIPPTCALQDEAEPGGQVHGERLRLVLEVLLGELDEAHVGGEDGDEGRVLRMLRHHLPHHRGRAELVRRHRQRLRNQRTPHVQYRDCKRLDIQSLKCLQMPANGGGF